MPEIRYLTIDQVRRLHRRALEAFGGLDGVRSEQLLASAVFQPQASAFGEDAYPTLVEKAAAYGFFLAENQPFIDGNKRTAAWAMVTFLDLNGYELEPADDDEVAVAFEQLGSDVLDQAGFFAWVALRAQQTRTIEEARVIDFPTER